MFLNEPFLDFRQFSPTIKFGQIWIELVRSAETGGPKWHFYNSAENYHSVKNQSAETTLSFISIIL